MAPFQLHTQAFDNPGRVALNLTFPDSDDTPAFLYNLGGLPRIACNGIFKFLLPESRVCSGYRRLSAPFVAMPVTTIYEDSRLVLWQKKVRFSRKSLVMQSVAETSAMQE